MTDTAESPFPAPGSHADLEAGRALTPKFSADGLVTAVTVAAADNEVLMVAHMNAQALDLTLRTGIAHYWSRSRGAIWKKGETSGNMQTVREIRVDCDQDALVVKVETQGDGANCHTGRRSCFYRTVDGEAGAYSLVFDENDQPRFDPDAVYSR